MSDSDLKHELAKLEDSITVPTVPDESAPVQDAKEVARQEERFYADLHDMHLAERKAAMGQRGLYAKLVFALVCIWILAIFALLIFQVFGMAITSQYKPLGDNVLIALISSTTANLIGTLIIVLKYIFRAPEAAPATSVSSYKPQL